MKLLKILGLSLLALSIVSMNVCCFNISLQFLTFPNTFVFILGAAIIVCLIVLDYGIVSYTRNKLKGKQIVSEVSSDSTDSRS